MSSSKIILAKAIIPIRERKKVTIIKKLKYCFLMAFFGALRAPKIVNRCASSSLADKVSEWLIRFSLFEDAFLGALRWDENCPVWVMFRSAISVCSRVRISGSVVICSPTFFSATLLWRGAGSRGVVLTRAEDRTVLEPLSNERILLFSEVLRLLKLTEPACSFFALLSD